MKRVLRVIENFKEELGELPKTKKSFKYIFNEDYKENEDIVWVVNHNIIPFPKAIVFKDEEGIKNEAFHIYTENNTFYFNWNESSFSQYTIEDKEFIIEAWQ